MEVEAEYGIDYDRGEGLYHVELMIGTMPGFGWASTSWEAFWRAVARALERGRKVGAFEFHG